MHDLQLNLGSEAHIDLHTYDNWMIPHHNTSQEVSFTNSLFWRIVHVKREEN